MLNAVEWCIEKQLIQEGFTLLQEGIISYLLNNDCKDTGKREFVSGYLQHQFKGSFNYHKFDKLRSDEKDDLESLLNEIPQIKKWAELYKDTTEYRNDINHAGVKSNAKSGSEFENKLKELYTRTNQLVKLC